MLRIIGGIVAGIAAVLATTLALEWIAHRLFPMPSSGGAFPVGIQLFVVGAWLAAALAGGYLSGRIVGARWAVWLIAALCSASAVATVLMIAHPVWMQIASVVAPIIGGMIAARLLGARMSDTATQAAGSDVPV